jgi:hypothetical protein
MKLDTASLDAKPHPHGEPSGHGHQGRAADAQLIENPLDPPCWGALSRAYQPPIRPLRIPSRRKEGGGSIERALT